MIQTKQTVLQPSTETAKFYSKELSKMRLCLTPERNNKCCKEAPSTVAKQVRHSWKDFSTTCTTCHQNFQHSVNSNYSITSQQHGSLPRCQTMLWSFPQLSTEYWATFGVWHCIFTSYSHHTKRLTKFLYRCYSQSLWVFSTCDLLS